MKDAIESVLQTDHESLARLLTELDTELANPDLARAFELLDLFWARLAVHIRAENLHLFPALDNAPDSLFSGKDGLPTSEEMHETLSRLRGDHNFFMKELAQMMKVGRETRVGEGEGRKEAKELKQRLAAIIERLETHNRLEEKRVYLWPSLLFDEQTVVTLSDRMQHELDNTPARFVSRSAPLSEQVLMKAHFILYVSDQERSTAFYSSVLGERPTLNAPGMTEFTLSDSSVLGLMPESGIVKLLGKAIVPPSAAHGVPRSELYLVVGDAAAFHARAVDAGASEVSPLALRDWGHAVAYSLDPDGHVLAFASPVDGPAGSADLD